MISRRHLLSGAFVATLAAGTLAPPILAQAPGTGLGIDTTSFDRSVRPQDDFFRFVNGTWLKNTEIPADRARYGSFDALAEESQKAVRAIIEETAKSTTKTPGSEAQKLGDLYTSFMDTAAIEAAGLKPIQPELARVAELSDKQALPELFAHLARNGVQTPISFFIGQDPKQATRYIAMVNQSGLGLPDRDYYLQDAENFQKQRAAYQAYIETLFRLAGQPNPAEAAKNILALETRIAEKHWERARTRDREATYNLKTIAAVDQLTPSFSFSRFVAAMGAEKTPGVVVRQPDYIQGLDGILRETPLATLKQYLTFKVLDDAAGALPKAFRDAQFAFRGRILSGQPEQRPRWQLAVNTVNSVLGEATGKLYVERHFSPAQKERMQELVANLRSAFQEGIDDLEWMSPATKQQAQAKLAKFNVKIGYPDKWKDYSALSISSTDLMGNLHRAANWSWNDDVSHLGKPIDRTEWGMTPQTVNAYYSSTMNEIVFPAAIIQPPFFNPDADDAVNYGAIGAVIGHEISHGFDDQGSRSDGDGNLRNWFTDQDLQEFRGRTDALAAQYGSYEPVPGTKINGKLTLGENIGDLSGLTIAYRAYQKSLGGKPAPVIAGFTGDQRFFLGFAQIWRAKIREEALRQQLLTDPHSPGEYRATVPLKNMPEFYAAFGVKQGDGMFLPADQRVKVW
jgi:predicted metalloendopeptidase